MTTGLSKTPKEQIIYSNLLFYGSWAAIAILLITYLIYISGTIDAYIPIDKLPYYWSKPVNEYVHEANIPLGWGWVSLLNKGDFLNLIGIVFLAGMTIICFLVLLMEYIRKKEMPFVAIVLLEVIVLIVSASGLLGAGGH
ncbi:MAG TPA: hypothetical protein VMW42_11575 [Desulfatiglandales bacterium]|nr:hypothetical protein [Desulfatiglandales bacterium]